jgi:ABC-type multidrug transport system ATPase subunit
VYYGSIDALDAKPYRGEIVYNGEDDIHYPTLTVGQTLRLALKSRMPHKRLSGESRHQYVKRVLDTFLQMFGISHTINTKVGNESVRGVSGGERKRVSIAEVLAARATITAFDNSTRGLDASTALEYVKSIRILSDVSGCTNIVSIYQAGENIYELFDK